MLREPLRPCAGQLGACKEVVQRVLEHMGREPAAEQRVPHFYLLDAILAVSLQHLPACCLVIACLLCLLCLLRWHCCAGIAAFALLLLAWRAAAWQASWG